MKSLNEYADRLFMALISMVSIYVASSLRDLSQSVNELNLKLSLYMLKSETQERIADDHEARLRIIEGKK